MGKVRIKHGSLFRCINCGKFMSYKDLDEGHREYIPETDWTNEEIKFSHKKCK